MSFKSLTKALHDVVLEESPEEKTTGTHTPTPAPAPIAAYAAAPAMAVPSTSPVTVDAGAIYGVLLEKTNFESTPMHQTIHKYTEAMKSAPLDDLTKLKIAFAQATQLDHITPDMVRKEFATLKQNLAAEHDKFSIAIQGKTSTIQGTRQTADQLVSQIAAKQKEIEDLNQKRTNLLVEAETETQHVAALTAQFEAASVRRTQELDKQLSDLETVMK
jgi:hypothetical protein